MKQWIKLQRHLYEQCLEGARAPVARKSRALKAYEKRFHADFQQLKPSHSSALLRAMNQASLTLIGDFHTLRQSQRFLLRLLKDRRVRKPKALALEVLYPKHRPLLASFLKDPSPLHETRLKRALQLESHWGSDFETYKDIFQTAHKNGMALIPLGTSQKTLQERDRSMAGMLAKQPTPTWALVGEFHCARPHLPQQIVALDKTKSITIVLQNDDRLTLKHQNIQRETDSEREAIYSVAKSSQWPTIDVFSVLHTPLWIKYQSLMEHYLEGEDREGGDIADPRAQIVWSLKTLDRFLRDPRYELKSLEKDLKSLHVFKADSRDFYRVLSRYSPRRRQELLRQIKMTGIGVSARDHSIFLSETTINACSHAAGLYLFQTWTSTTLESLETADSLLMETMAFFLSKLLNHSRRPPRHFSTVTQSFFSALKSRPLSPAHIKIAANQSLLPLARQIGDLCFEAFLAEEFSRSRLLRLLQTCPQRDRRSLLYLNELASLALSFRRRDKLKSLY